MPVREQKAYSIKKTILERMVILPKISQSKKKKNKKQNSFECCFCFLH